MEMASHDRCSVRRRNLKLLRRFLILLIVFLQVERSNCDQFFEVQPEDTTVLNGESFTLFCTVANKVGVTYWEKDNVTFAVPGDGQKPASARWAVFGDLDTGEYNLQVLQAEQSDEGTYMCKSTGSERDENGISSAPADVVVMAPPTGSAPICLTSKTGNLVEGDPVDFTCAFAPTDGDGNTTTVSWVRSGPRVSQLSALPLSSIVGREGYVVRKMTVAITIEDHLASYTCIVRDGSTGDETPTCSTGSLLVQHSPIVEISPASIGTTEGNSANFTCTLISAYPTDTSYEWYYMGRVVQPGGTKFILGNVTDGKTLRVLDLSGNDDGAQVTCVVSNSLGSGTATSVITLSERPFDLERDILIWLIPLGAIALVLMLVIFLAIWLLDCRLMAKCCDKRKHNVQGPKARTWSMANLAMTLRETGPVDLDDEYFIARSIRSRENTGIRPDTNTEDRKKPLPEDHVNPNFILEKEGTTDRERLRKTRGERDRLRKRGVENDYGDDNLDVGKDKSLARIKKQDSQNDSGLEGMSSSKESNGSPTLKRLNNNVKAKKALYAEVERQNLGLDR